MQELQQRKQVITETPERTATLTQQEDTLSSSFAQDGISYGTVTLASSGAGIQVDSVPAQILEKVEKFYVCCTCGKVFWQGSHFERVCDQFDYVLIACVPPPPSAMETTSAAENHPDVESSETADHQEDCSMNSSALAAQAREANSEAGGEVAKALAAEAPSDAGSAHAVVGVDDYDDYDSEESYDGFIC